MDRIFILYCFVGNYFPLKNNREDKHVKVTDGRQLCPHNPMSLTQTKTCGSKQAINGFAGKSGVMGASDISANN